MTSRCCILQMIIPSRSEQEGGNRDRVHELGRDFGTLAGGQRRELRRRPRARSSGSSGRMAPGRRRRSTCSARCSGRARTAHRSTASTWSVSGAMSAGRSASSSSRRRSTTPSRPNRTSASTPTPTGFQPEARERGSRAAGAGRALGPRRDRVKTFSGGMKRRLEIARGLLHHPARSVPRRADARSRPPDAPPHLGLPRRSPRAGGPDDLPDDPLHGRGRALRSDRGHRPR